VDAVVQSKHLIQQIKTLPPESLKHGVPYRIKGRVKTDRSPSWLPFDRAGVVGGDAKSTGDGAQSDRPRAAQPANARRTGTSKPNSSACPIARASRADAERPVQL